MASLVSESLQGVRVAKTYGLEGYLKGRARGRLRRDPQPQDEVRQRARPARPAARGRAAASRSRACSSSSVGASSTGQHGRRFHRFRHRAPARRAADPVARATSTPSSRRRRAACSAYFAMMDEKPAIVDRPGARDARRRRSGEIRFERVALPLSRRRAGARRHGPRRARRAARRRSSAAPAPASRRCCRSCRASST